MYDPVPAKHQELLLPVVVGLRSSPQMTAQRGPQSPLHETVSFITEQQPLHIMIWTEEHETGLHVSTLRASDIAGLNMLQPWLSPQLQKKVLRQQLSCNQVVACTLSSPSQRTLRIRDWTWHFQEVVSLEFRLDNTGQLDLRHCKDNIPQLPLAFEDIQTAAGSA